MPELKQEEVLRYQKGRRNQSTVKRHYLQWRSEQDPPIPEQCDMEDCIFHEKDLIWRGEKLGLILDHKNGVSGDNRPENLRLMCPNCNSQQKTHGGGNKGRVEQSDGGFATKDEDGKRHYVLPVETAHMKLTGHDVEFSVGDEQE